MRDLYEQASKAKDSESDAARLCACGKNGMLNNRRECGDVVKEGVGPPHQTPAIMSQSKTEARTRGVVESTFAAITSVHPRELREISPRKKRRSSGQDGISEA